MENRLENLKSAYRMNWKELAEELGISRSLLDFIRAGKVPVSPKNLRKIEAAEIKCGISAKSDVLPPPIVRESPADFPPGHGDIMAKLDEIITRLDALEKRDNKKGK